MYKLKKYLCFIYKSQFLHPPPATGIIYRQRHRHCLCKHHLMETGPVVAREGAKDRAVMLKTIQL